MKWKAERDGKREIARIFVGKEFVGFVCRNSGALEPAHRLTWAAYIFVDCRATHVGSRRRRCWAKRLVEGAAR